ncbi:MAG: OmpH family outer membrane protein [Breznakibacter sp.]|nr:OmpH family outer membrane protein [Breznakibacter sp.]
MNKTNIITTSILSVAIAALFVLHFTSSSCNSKATPQSGSDSNNLFPIAYVDTDSLLLQYNYAKKINEDLLAQEEKSRTSFNEKAKSLQNDVAEFQRKVQNNGFLSLERAQQAQEELRAREAQLQELNQKLSRQLMEEQERVTKQLRDDISSFLKEYNKNKGYKIILSNAMGASVLYSEKSVNITKDVVAALNANYEKNKK